VPSACTSRNRELLSHYNTARLSPKTLTCVGWVEERNPTFSWLCWVTLREAAPRLRKASTQPTIFQNLRSIDTHYSLLITHYSFNYSVTVAFGANCSLGSGINVYLRYNPPQTNKTISNAPIPIGLGSQKSTSIWLSSPVFSFHTS
jgi:hypothetical protein